MSNFGPQGTADSHSFEQSFGDAWLLRREKVATTGGTVFIFPGRGAQWTGVATELLDTAPAFAEQMRRCDTAFTEFVDWSLLDTVRAGAVSPSVDRVDVAQPVLFALMVSLVAQWRALALQPDAVLGLSHGEIAAAYVAGALSLRDAAKVLTLRSKAIKAVCGQDDVPATGLALDHASHSDDVDALRETLRESLSGLQPRTGRITFISAVTGAGLDTTILDGDYWFANLRQPVLFEQGVRWAYEHGYRTFVECSPHPVPSVGVRESLQDYGDDHTVVGTLGCNFPGGGTGDSGEAARVNASLGGRG